MSGERNIPHLRDIFGGGGGCDDGLSDELRRLDVHERSSLGGVSAGGTDSAISVGSASEEDLLPSSPPAVIAGNGKGTAKKKRHRNGGGGSRSSCKGPSTVEDDVKHLERHLSMKKTIRKKIMRDLQQAFVEDPDEFKVEDIPPEQLKAELNSRSLSFGTPSKKKGNHAPRARFGRPKKKKKIAPNYEVFDGWRAVRGGFRFPRSFKTESMFPSEKK